jgi:hypothetical protein
MRGSLLHTTTDWRLLCRPISSIPAVWQLSAGKSVGRSDFSPDSPRGGGDGGKIRKQLLRARGEEALNRNCAEKITVEETCVRRWKCENTMG